MNASPFQKSIAKKDTVGIAVLALRIVATLAPLAILFLATPMQVP